MNLAILCPGQGSQTPGMLSPWLDITADDAPTAASIPPRTLIAQLSHATGLDLAYLGTAAPQEELTPTEVSQPLTLATSVLSALTVEARIDDAGFVTLPHAHETVTCGHSLGYLTALTIAGALSVTEAACVAAVRGRAMSRCGVDNPGTMVAIIGGEPDEVLQAIETAGAVAANINGSTQVVASGSHEALARLQLPARARAIPLPVSGAFHTEAMAGARQDVADYLTTLTLEDRYIQCALVDDTTGTLHQAGTPALPLIEAIADKITAPVRWDKVHDTLREQAITRAIIVAPSQALAGFVRRDLPGVELKRLTSPRTPGMPQ